MADHHQHTEKEIKLINLFCDALKNPKPKVSGKWNLINRLDNNDGADKSALIAANLWRGTKNLIKITVETETEEERGTNLVEMVCNKLKYSNGRRNALLPVSVARRKGSGAGAGFAAASKWIRRKSKNVVVTEEESSLIQEYVRRSTLRKSKGIVNELAQMQKEKKEAALNRFKTTVKRVCILTRVFRQMRMYAIEKGEHIRISSMMQNEDNEHVEKDLLFNQDDFKNKYQFCIPKWAYLVCSIAPEQRSKTEIQNLMHLMQPLKGFRKYSQKKQELLAKIVRYESFSRRRVIVRKGHVGLSFYLIYSGSVAIIIQGDEDKAFVDDSAPANIMKRGDSFGELALVKACTRSATVVCLEKTELFVIDKEAFFRLGIDTFSKEEIDYRHSCINCLDLFESVSLTLRKEIADEGRVLSFLSDKVIDSDSSDSQFIYFITKGCCYVLRLLDLSLQEKLAYQEKHPEPSVYAQKSPRSTISPLVISSGHKLDPSGTPPCGTSPPMNNIQILPPIPSKSSSTSSLSDTILEEETSDPLLGSRKDWSSLGSDRCTNSSSKKSTKSSTNDKKCRTTSRTQGERSKVRRLKKKAELMADKNLQRYCCTANFGLGVFLKVDSLYPGQSFGLNHMLNDGQDDRKFALVSSGCEVIRVPRTLIKEVADTQMMKKIQKTILPYPSDKELYHKFTIYNKWRCFREELVDHLADFRSNIDKALKERCSVIPPKAARNNSRASLMRSKSESYAGGKNMGSSGTWSNVPPPSRLSDITTTSSRQSPFVQEKLTVKSANERTLVLTHGGSRINDLQRATRSPLLKSKHNNRTLVNYR